MGIPATSLHGKIHSKNVTQAIKTGFSQIKNRSHIF